MHPVIRALALALLALPATAIAQVSPTAPVHPSLPWSGITTPQGQMIRFIYVPPQPVMLDYVVMGPTETPPPVAEPAPSVAEPAPPAAATPGPAAAAPGPPAAPGETKAADAPPEPTTAPSEGPPPGPRVVRQQVIVPGYYVRETTVGFHYPERWAIEQAAPNVYRWRQLPAQFVPK